MKSRIFLFADWYLPGYKGGGSVSAISNLVELVGDDFDFWIFTRDRDSREDCPYPGVSLDRWVKTGKAQILYTADLSFQNLRRRIREIEPHIIYLNSFFSRLTVRTLLLRKLHLLPDAAIALAPRGEFSPGALKLKPLRKRLYTKFALSMGLHRGLMWQASSTLEEGHIRSCLSRIEGQSETKVLVAPDAVSVSSVSRPYQPQRKKKISGAVDLVFLSRISPMKNLHFALEMLGSVKGEIALDIYGPIDDPAYWELCREKIRSLPAHIHVHFRGAVSPQQVLEVFSRYHFHLLPTLGENFGYVIVEGLAAGCPVLTSDQTPWRDLPKKQVGWDLPLENREQWRLAVQRCVEMDQNTYEALSLAARNYFEQWASGSDYRQSTIDLFQKSLGAATTDNVVSAVERSIGARG